MTIQRTILCAVLTTSFLCISAFSAVKPSFDCSKADSSAEELICSDSELAKLDLKMDEVFKASLKKANTLGDRPKEKTQLLRSMQIGWIKGRNDCWKSQNLRKCVKDQYEQRIPELQAEWALVKSQKPQFFQCKDRSEFALTQYATDLFPSVSIEYGDSRRIFIQTPSASGTKYNGEFGRSLWIKEKEAKLIWNQEKPEINCTKR